MCADIASSRRFPPRDLATWRQLSQRGKEDVWHVLWEVTISVAGVPELVDHTPRSLGLLCIAPRLPGFKGCFLVSHPSVARWPDNLSHWGGSRSQRNPALGGIPPHSNVPSSHYFTLLRKSSDQGQRFQSLTLRGRKPPAPGVAAACARCSSRRPASSPNDCDGAAIAKSASSSCSLCDESEPLRCDRPSSDVRDRLYTARVKPLAGGRC